MTQKKIEEFGFIKKNDGKKHQSNIVYDANGICPTICSGGDRMRTYINIVINDFYKSRAIRIFENICPTLMAGRQGLKVIEEIKIKQIGNLANQIISKRDNPQQHRVYNIHGLSPALHTMQGGGLQPEVIIYESINQTIN